jgi:hypothetical protein
MLDNKMYEGQMDSCSNGINSHALKLRGETEARIHAFTIQSGYAKMQELRAIYLNIFVASNKI